MLTNRQRFVVDGGCKARASFGAEASTGSTFSVDHIHNETALAREIRPVPTGAKSIEFKVHPNASHIDCELHGANDETDRVSLNVECGDPAEPIGRHFIVIGAMKAGTTTLFRALEQHPRLCRTWSEGPGPSFVKEINYFRRQYRLGDSPLHYDWRFPFAPGEHAWTLDVSPNYAKLPGSQTVPARIASLGARVKIAYILRDPVERVESHIAHWKQHGTSDRNIEHCIRLSCYAMHLDNFCSHFSKDDILLLDFEQLRRDPASLFGSIYGFLDIESVSPESEVHNQRSNGFELQSDTRREIAESVRPDVQRLIDEYGFSAARNWLRRPERRWFGISKNPR